MNKLFSLFAPKMISKLLVRACIQNNEDIFVVFSDLFFSINIFSKKFIEGFSLKAMNSTSFSECLVGKFEDLRGEYILLKIDSNRILFLWLCSKLFSGSNGLINRSFFLAKRDSAE